MGVDIVPLAVNHKLDMRSEKALATNISTVYAGPVTMFEEKYDETNGWHWIEQFRINHPQDNEVQISASKNHPYEGEGQSYEIEVEKDGKRILDVDVYKHYVDLYYVDSPFKWSGLIRTIVDGNVEARSWLTDYRKRLMSICYQVGSKLCMYLPDDCVGVWEKSRGDDCTYEVLIDYIKRQDGDNGTYSPYRLVDMPECLLPTAPRLDEDCLNIFYDDFRDLLKK